MDLGVFDHLDRRAMPVHDAAGPGPRARHFPRRRLPGIVPYEIAYFGHLTKLWRDFGAIPIRFARDFDEARERGITIAGTPARVREEIERQITASMSEAEASASIDLFTAEVMPPLRALSP